MYSSHMYILDMEDVITLGICLSTCDLPSHSRLFDGVDLLGCGQAEAKVHVVPHLCMGRVSMFVTPLQQGLNINFVHMVVHRTSRLRKLE